MARAQVTLLSSVLVAMLVLPAGAQTPTQTPADTVATDSVPAKKQGRFGGLLNKAKKVASNKAMQDAAKGAATGVACTVVPGAAVVSAATGTGPCANAGLAALIKKGGVQAAATTMASGAAANAASKTVGTMTGVKGAAASGALGAVGGQGGLAKAAASAAKSAITQKTGISGVGSAASSAASIAAQAAAARAISGAGATSGKKGTAASAAMPNSAEMAAAMSALGTAMGSVGTVTAGANKVETVDFRELKALLPESLRGMKRTEATGQKTAAMGIQMSSAEGEYSAADGNSVKLTIVDIGSVTGLAAGAAYAWAATEIDRDGDSGYEKTTMFKGFKALEKYDRQSRSGELSVLVEGRFVVGAQGSNVDMDAIKAAVGGVDLRKLAGMKGRGVK